MSQINSSSLERDVEAFLARGGKIQEVPGFTEVKPRKPVPVKKIESESSKRLADLTKQKIEVLPDGHITLADVAEKLGKTPGSVHNAIRDGRFPPPRTKVKIHGNHTAIFALKEIQPLLDAGWDSLRPMITNPRIADLAGIEAAALNETSIRKIVKRHAAPVKWRMPSGRTTVVCNAIPKASLEPVLTEIGQFLERNGRKEAV